MAKNKSKSNVNIGDIVKVFIEEEEQILEYESIKKIPMTIVGYVAKILNTGFRLTMNDPTGKKPGRFYTEREYTCYPLKYEVLVRKS